MSVERKRRILLVDDDTSLLMTLSDFFGYEGYEVVTADSGEKGLERLAGFKPDLIILDMSMPGMGGLGFLSAISDGGGKPRYAVLVLSARAALEAQVDRAGVEGFMVKPCDPDDLLQEAKRILGTRSGLYKSASEVCRGGRVLSVLVAGECAAIVQGLNDSGFQVESVRRWPDVLERALILKPDVAVLPVAFDGMGGDAIVGVLREMSSTAGIRVVLYGGVEGRGLFEGSPVPRGVRHLDTAEAGVVVAAVADVAQGLVGGY